MFIKCLSIRSGSLVQIFVRSCFSISCGSHPVYVHLQWHKILKHPFAWSARVLPQLLLHPASLLAAPVPGWVSPLWETLLCWNVLFVCNELHYNLIAVHTHWPVLHYCTLYRTLQQLPSSLQAEEETFPNEKEESKLRYPWKNWSVLPPPRIPSAHPFPLSI